MSISDLSSSFDSIAAAYDRTRPEYPQAVFERIIEYAQLKQAPADILEIGSGTGKATGPLAQLGHRLVCLEPGPSLAQFARRRFTALPNILVQETSFEQWEPGQSQFDVAFVAQAFHWLDPTLRLSKLAQVLRPNGALAIFGHSSDIPSAGMSADIRSAYLNHAPDLAARDNAKSWYASPVSPITEEIKASHLFRDFEFHAVAWSRDVSSEAYCDLIATYSDHSTLPTAQREALLNAIDGAIQENGGVVHLDYRTGLFLARVV